MVIDLTPLWDFSKPELIEQRFRAANEPDPYVFEELETLYRAKGNDERANHYSTLRKPVVK